MDKKIFTNMDTFTFASSVENFDQHISSAIPWYEDLYYMTMKAAEYFCLPNTNIYDLWCSSGKLITELSQNNPWSFVGIEIEKWFFDKYISSENLCFENSDILGYEYKNASLIISLFTIQFLDYSSLESIFQKVYDGLLEWGGFIFSCKEYSSNGFFQNIKTSIYWQRREEWDFPIEEQFKKDLALRKQMRIYESKYLVSHLQKIGFEVEEIWRNYNFAWYICRKVTS